MKKFIVIFIILSLLLTGCQDIQPVNNKDTTKQNNEYTAKQNNEDIQNVINSSDKIIIKKQLVTMNAGYDVLIDNKKVATVDGKYVTLFGDVFSLNDKYGNKLSSEKQIKRWNIKINRLAEVFDLNDETIGFIGEEKFKDFLKYGYKFHFYDKEKNEIAYTKDIFFSILKKLEIYNMQNEMDYIISENFNIAKNQYTIEIKNKESIIPVNSIILFTCIIDTIMTSENEK